MSIKFNRRKFFRRYNDYGVMEEAIFNYLKVPERYEIIQDRQFISHYLHRLDIDLWLVRIKFQWVKKDKSLWKKKKR